MENLVQIWGCILYHLEEMAPIKRIECVFDIQFHHNVVRRQIAFVSAVFAAVLRMVCAVVAVLCSAYCGGVLRVLFKLC